MKEFLEIVSEEMKQAFEKAGYTYANYKVRLTAVLLNSNGSV